MAGDRQPTLFEDVHRDAGLLPDPDPDGDLRYFALPLDGGRWGVGHWALCPKLAYDGVWFACWWHGPDSRQHTCVPGGAEIPDGIGTFESREEATAALVAEYGAGVLEQRIHRRTHAT